MRNPKCCDCLTGGATASSRPGGLRKSIRPAVKLLMLLALCFGMFGAPALVAPTPARAVGSYQSVEKHCGHCGHVVSPYAKIGDVCPYCGVRWGYENTTRRVHYVRRYRYGHRHRWHKHHRRHRARR
jgi:hypothetical protein